MGSWASLKLSIHAIVRVVVSTEFFQNWLKIYTKRKKLTNVFSLLRWGIRQLKKNWPIQDFPKGGGEEVGVSPTCGFGARFFVKNCMKVRGEGECRSLVPLGSANAKRFKTTNVFGLLQLRTFEVGTLSEYHRCATVPHIITSEEDREY